MFERYTEKARRVVFFARREASQFGSGDAIAPEHLLLGLLRESTPAVSGLFKVPLETIRQEVEASFKERPNVPVSVTLPLAVEGKRVLDLAVEESQRLGKSHIGIEHLLLGLLRADETPAAAILGKNALMIEEVRTQILSSPARYFDDSAGSR